jgi:hypothetical protein
MAEAVIFPAGAGFTFDGCSVGGSGDSDGDDGDDGGDSDDGD